LDSLFFVFSKVAWFLISPDSLLLIWFLIGIVALWLDKVTLSKYLLIPLLTIFLLIAVFPVGNWLLYPLESKYAPNPSLDNVDGIIVLAGSEDAVMSAVWDQVVTGGAIERDLAFMALAKKYPDAKLVFTGGSGLLMDQEYKPADVAKQLFEEQGMNVANIIFERESRNTSENVVFTKRLVKPSVDENWILITTGWHMPRSMGIFCKAEWKVAPYPVDFRTNPDKLFQVGWDFSGHLNGLKLGIKEWVGLLVYRITGKAC